MAYSMEEEIDLMTAGIESEGAAKRIRGLIRAKHAIQQQSTAAMQEMQAKLEAKDTEIGQMAESHNQALEQARAQWVNDSGTDLKLSDLGIRNDFDRKTLREYHASVETEVPVNEWAETMRANDEQRGTLPNSVRSLLEQQTDAPPTRATPNPDNGTSRPPGPLTADQIRDMPPDDFDKLTGRA